MLVLSFSLVFYFISCNVYADNIVWEISPDSREVSQGGIARIRISNLSSADVIAHFRKRDIIFFPGKSWGTYEALLGVDLEERPGSQSVIVQQRTWGKENGTASIIFQVIEKKFPVEKLTVPKSKDRFDQATLRRIRQEKARLNRLWKSTSRKRWWQEAFIVPVLGGITSTFGIRRVINGMPRSPHGGVDLRAKLGAKVVASNYGRVALLDDFFFSGKSLVLDHGGSLFTMYFHLDSFQVETGSWVNKGEVIGHAGMTGRITGPHLHWGVRLNGARVDPFALLALN